MASADANRDLATAVLAPGSAERLEAHVLGSIEAKRRLLATAKEHILNAATLLTECLASSGKILLCGNGGSAADCQHIAAEFVSVLNQSFLRPGLAAIALTTDTSILTAIANDFGYGGVFERQVQALGKPGDVLIGLSTSGNSENVLRAFVYARQHRIKTVGLTGTPGGKFGNACDICIRVPAESTQFIQESHIMIGHIVCDLVERSLEFGSGPSPRQKSFLLEASITEKPLGSD
jgi:D-sedoheptulose 7-phosphate isomerase